MAPIDDAIAAIVALDNGQHFTYTEIANWFSVSRVTLARRYKGSQGSQDARKVARQKLNHHQEEELVQYIEHLTKRALPPTNKMIQNFATAIGGQYVGASWVTRFIRRHREHLVSRWTTGIDANRHNADSRAKYKLYFDLLHSKIVEYDI